MMRFFENRSYDRVVMEACATAHHRARWLRASGIKADPLLAQYVKAYVRRNKTIGQMRQRCWKPCVLRTFFRCT
jgi:hypothetical protein